MSPWTDDRLAMLKELYPTHSLARCAELLSTTGHPFTCGSIAGRAQRDGLVVLHPKRRRTEHQWIVPARARKKGTDGGMAYRVANSRRRKEVKPPTADPFDAIPVPATSINIPFMQYGYGQCVFPTQGAGMHMLVCGHVAPDGEPYCSAHAAICYEHRRVA